MFYYSLVLNTLLVIVLHRILCDCVCVSLFYKNSIILFEQILFGASFLFEQKVNQISRKLTKNKRVSLCSQYDDVAHSTAVQCNKLLISNGLWVKCSLSSWNIYIRLNAIVTYSALFVKQLHKSKFLQFLNVLIWLNR